MVCLALLYHALTSALIPEGGPRALMQGLFPDWQGSLVLLGHLVTLRSYGKQALVLWDLVLS